MNGEQVKVSKNIVEFEVLKAVGTKMATTQKTAVFIVYPLSS
jgi:hypothetical protein